MVIPSKANRKRAIRYDREIYKQRNLVKRCFNKLKHFRRIAVRFDRLDCHFIAALHLAATMIWLRRMSIQPRNQVKGQTRNRAPLPESALPKSRPHC